MGKGNSDSVIPPLKMSDGNYAFTDLEKATTLNNYFCSISSVDDSNTELPFFENRTNTEINDINILVSEIVDILSSLKVNKASGPDGISHRMLKNTCKTIAIPLSQCISERMQNRRLRNGQTFTGARAFSRQKCFVQFFIQNCTLRMYCYIGLACPSTIFQNIIISGMEAL